MTLHDARDITKAVVFATPALWLAWDLVAELAFGHRATESHWFWTTALRHRSFPIAILAAMAALWIHFFWGFWGGPTPENLAR